MLLFVNLDGEDDETVAVAPATTWQSMNTLAFANGSVYILHKAIITVK